MLQDSVKNIFAVAELRKRVLFTLGMLAVYRVGSHVTIPGINKEALAILAEQARNTMFGLYDMFSGQNLSQMTIFALGIMPYISASIILQLLTVVWPYLERLSHEGELGRRKITQYTRYGTIFLSIVQAAAIALFLERQTNIAGGLPLVYHGGWGFRLMTILTLTTGSRRKGSSAGARSPSTRATAPSSWRSCRRSASRCSWNARRKWPAASRSSTSPVGRSGS